MTGHPALETIRPCRNGKVGFSHAFVKILVLQHASFEGPGEIAAWAGQRGHAVEVRHLYRGDAVPSLDTFDLLVIMGGEMNIYQDRDWPWLKPEREFIAAALAAGKRAIGICLGSQLIADALGARVTQNPEIELGWWPIDWTEAGRAVYPELPGVSTVLHWHGDTFALPAGATLLAASPACPRQGYVLPGKCLGLQFHIEVDPTLVKEYVEGQENWPCGSWVQTRADVLANAEAYCEKNRRLLHAMLDRFVL